MRSKKEAGTSLPETLVAVAICTIVVFGLAALVGAATQQTKAQGQITTLCATFASQKVDQLTQLQFDVSGTATALQCGSPPCGSLTSDSTGYFEYLDPNGTLVPSATGFGPGIQFVRRWTVDYPSTTIIKVTVYVESWLVSPGEANTAKRPSAYVATLKAKQ